MSCSLATEQEEDFTLSPSTVQSLIQSERDLYPELFQDDNDIFHSEPGEDNKINAEKFAVCQNRPEKTAIEPVMEANVVEDAEAPHYFDGNPFGDFNFTSIPAPPISHSNPETPTEPLEMSFDTNPPEMARNLSDQSPLAPRMTRYANSELEARLISQGQVQVLPSTSKKVPKSRAGTPGPRSGVNSITVSRASTPIVRPQAGPEQINRYEPAARFSNVRPHHGPSGLRNSISAPSEEHGRQLSSSSQQYPHPVQVNDGTPSLSEQVQSHGTQYRHGFGSPSPQIWAQDHHEPPYKAQMHMHNRTNSIGNFTSHDHFSDLYNTNSPHTIHSSPFSEDRVHANMTQENVNPSRYQNELLIQQTPNYLPYTTQHLPQHRRTLSYEQGLFPNMNMNPEEYPSEPRQSRLKYQCLDDARREKSVSTHNPRVDPTVPHSAEDDCVYVERMVEAMLDMSLAEDNAGMKRTWETMKRDLDKVEKAAWEILNLCKMRHARNGPFEMSPKVLRQYDTFQDRIQTICEAMQTQKTLCKHLLRQPFNEEVVEDPIAAVSRIKNNRKVNHGKKEAIDKGREALGEKGHGKGRRTTKVAQEDTDDEYEGEDDEYGSQAGAQMHALQKRSVSQSHAPVSRRQASSDDPLDQTYREGSASKKAKRPSRSVYQLNDHNQMIDISQPQLKPEHGSMQRPSHEHLHVDPNDPYGFHGMAGVADARHGDPLFGSSTAAEFGQHQQAQAEGRRRVARR